jgi:hypothetical protein
MHNRTLLSALAAAAIVAIATPSISQAQDTTTKKVSTGEVALKPNFGSLMSALKSAAAQNAKWTAMTTELTAENVQLVNVDSLLQGNNVEALNSALKTNEADVTTLRKTLGANTGLATILKSNTPELTADDVIATDVGADGKVVVYYWKKSVEPTKTP